MRTLLSVGLLAGIASFALGGAAHAQRASNITGETLVKLCTSKDPKAVEGCNAYVAGVSDAVDFYQSKLPADGSKGGKLFGYICVPGPTTGVQMRQKVVDWYGKHPAAAKISARSVVLQSLDEAYPCPGEGRRLGGAE